MQLDGATYEKIFFHLVLGVGFYGFHGTHVRTTWRFVETEAFRAEAGIDRVLTVYL